MKKIYDKKINIKATIATLTPGESVHLSPMECGITMSSVRVAAYRAGKSLGYNIRVFEVGNTAEVIREA